MATHDEASGRGRTRIRNLASAALNADATIDQATTVLDGLGDTVHVMESTMTRFDATLERMNRDLGDFERLLAAFQASLDRVNRSLDKVDALLSAPTAVVSAAERVMAVPSGAAEAITRRLLHREH